MDNNNDKNLQENREDIPQNSDFAYENEASRLNGYLFTEKAADGPFEDKGRKKLLSVWKWVGILSLIIVVTFVGAFAGVAYVCQTSIMKDSAFFDAFVARWAGVTVNRVEVNEESYTYAGSNVQLAETALNSTVKIRVFKGQGENAVEYASGSGIIYAREGNAYTVLTNEHVIKNTDTFEITTYDGERYVTSKVVAKDEVSDVALLRFESAKDYTVATHADSDKAKAGQGIVVAGNPLGHGFGVSYGYVSNPSRVTTANYNVPLMTLDVSVNPGNSGGGVFDLEGNLLALVVSKASGTDVDGIGYAVPIKFVDKIVDDLLRLGYVSGRPMIGITVTSIYSVEVYDAYMKDELKGYLLDMDNADKASKFGVYVIESENPKLQKGDRIIQVDGHAISIMDEISQIVLGHEVGEVIEIEVERLDGSGGYERKTFEIHLIEKKSPD